MSLTPKLLAAAVAMAFAGAASAANIDNPAVSRALGLLQTHGGAAHASANDRFISRDVIVDADGTEHVRFDRTYAGLPVIGGDIVVHSRNGQLKSTSLTQRAVLSMGTRANIKADEAIVSAGARFGSDFTGTPTSRLVVYALGAKPSLAHEVVFSGTRADQTPTEMHYFISATDGRLLNKWDAIETASAAGTAKTLYSGNVAITTNSLTSGYELRDPTRGSSKTINGATGRTSGLIYKDADNTWGNNATSDLATAAADAQFGVATTWDFFKNSLGRNGITGTGRGSYNRVHFGTKYNNAFWSDGCFCMTYGDGDGATLGPLVSLDIAGHEMTHGVTSRTAGLVYSGESGGLNEATSDIMGTMVEFYANNALDTPDYMIGEEIFIANVSGSPDQMALRYMFDPIKDGLSPNCYYPEIGSPDFDVHFSSGVANLFFYLLAEGSGAKTFSGVDHTPTTCNGSTLTGIGRTKAQKIWYRALTVYMTSSTDYAGARTATMNAANDLYGSADRAAVAAAWSAVDVN